MPYGYKWVVSSTRESDKFSLYKDEGKPNHHVFPTDAIVELVGRMLIHDNVTVRSQRQNKLLD